MTNTEIIRAIQNEIERLLTKWETADHLAEGLLSFLSTLESEKPMCQEELELNSIAYLEQLGYTCIPEGAHTEKPMNLEEAFESEFAKFSNDPDAFYAFPIDLADYKDFASQFYELGCRRTAEKYDEIEYERQMAEESVPNELEEAAEEYEHNRVYEEELEKYGSYLDSIEEGEEPKMKEPSKETKFLLNADIIKAFIAGAKWQKDQMMDEAVEIGTTEIYWEPDGNRAFPTFDPPVEDLLMPGIISQKFNEGDKVRVIVMKKED